MKRNILKLLLIGFVMSSGVLTSCGDDEGDVFITVNGQDDGGDTSGNTLSGNITSDITVGENEKWTLEGTVVVQDGVTLTIEKGAILEANPGDGVDALFISQGAKILAEGTATQPIVMTSTVRERGSFGGLVLLGKAPINVSGGVSSSELGTEYVYGGTDATDNSGVLKYVRIEYAGKKNSADKEFNGFTFYGVGSGTVVENLQAYYGSDDGFEFFGGTVVANNLISTGNEDDAIDWTEGWTGGGENWIVELADDDGDFGFESSGNDDDSALQPYSNPTVRNVTITGGAASITEEKSAIRLKSGTNITIENVVIEGFPKGIRFDKEQSVDFLTTGSMKIDKVKFGSSVDTKYVNKTDYDAATFDTATANVVEDATATGATIADRNQWSLGL